MEGSVVNLVGELCSGLAADHAFAVFNCCRASGVRSKVFFCNERKIRAVDSSNWLCTTRAEYSF